MLGARRPRIAAAAGDAFPPAPEPLAVDDASWGSPASFEEDPAAAEPDPMETASVPAAVRDAVSPAEPALTDALADRELFEDPTLDVARMSAGEEREIVVPVEIASAGGVRRFKLSVRLRLDPVD